MRWSTRAAAFGLVSLMLTAGAARAAPGGLPACEWCGAADAPADSSWRTTIAPADEPGTRLIVSGVVYERDGTTPAPGVLIYVYHTDAAGRYSRGENLSGNGRRHGKLRGWMRTGADGRYEFETIRPGSYPDTRAQAHIHVTLSRAPGAPGEPGAPGDAAHPWAEEFYIDEYWFMDDPFVSDRDKARSREQGRFGAVIVTMTDEKGVMRATRDVKFDPPATLQPRS